MLQGGRQDQNINLHALLCFCLRMRCVGSTRGLAAAIVLRWRLQKRRTGRTTGRRIATKAARKTRRSSVEMSKQTAARTNRGTTASTTTRATTNELGSHGMEDPQNRHLHVFVVYPQERPLLDMTCDTRKTWTITRTESSITMRTTAKINASATTSKVSAMTATTHSSDALHEACGKHGIHAAAQFL